MPTTQNRRTLLFVEIDAEINSSSVSSLLAGAGFPVLDVTAYDMDPFRGGEDAPEQHCRPDDICRSCGWVFRNDGERGEGNHCVDCSEAIDYETEAAS